MAGRLGVTSGILAAADVRDAISDSRDIGSDTREQHLDRGHSPAKGRTLGDDLPLRKGTALDRDHAKGDRKASRADGVALSAGPEGAIFLT